MNNNFTMITDSRIKGYSMKPYKERSRLKFSILIESLAARTAYLIT